MAQKAALNKRDRTRINIHEEDELEEWSDHFGVSKDKIKQAVKAVGTMANDLATWLKTN